MRERLALRRLAQAAGVDTVHVRWDVESEQWDVWVLPTAPTVSGPSLARCAEQLLAEIAS